MNIQLVENPDRLARIKVLGLGGAGGNAVNRMIESGLTGVEFHAVNTDAQALKQSRAHQVLAIGAELTRGLGAGGNPAVGRQAAEADRDLLARVVDGADMVFVTAGMGGGTGTGAAPVAAAAARAAGALTVAIVTRPFAFEGDVRRRQADAGIAELREQVDTLIVIPNQRLLEVVAPTASMQEAFRTADDVLYQATRGIYEIIARPAIVNLDFADVRTVMQGMGVALVGIGHAAGEDRAVAAARAAIASPLLEDVDVRGARAVLVNLVGAEVSLQDTAQAMQHVQDAAGPQAHIIFGYGVDEALGDQLQVTVIATGFPDRAEARGAGGTITFATVPAATAAAAPAAAAPEPECVPAPMADPDPVVAPAPALVAQPEPEFPAADAPQTEFAFARAAEPEPAAAAEPARWAEPEPATAAEPARWAEPEPQAAEPARWAEPEPQVAEPARWAEPEPAAAAEPARWAEPAAQPELAAILARMAEVSAGPPTPAWEDGAPAPAAADAAPVADRAMAAAAGGADERWAPQAAPAGPTESSLEPMTRFLRPAGSQDLRPAPERPGHRVRGDALADDLNLPAYTRKYMD